MIEKVLSNRVVKNAGWLIGGRVVQMILNLAIGLLTARYLGPAGYGLINYAAAYTGFFTSFCTLGINSVLVKEFVDLPDKDGEIIGTSIVLRAISSILSALSIICFVIVADRGEPITILVVTLSSIGPVFHVFEVFNYWFQAKLRSKVTAVATLTAYIVTAVYKVFLLMSGASVVYFALATSIDYICLAVFLCIAYRRNGGGRLSFSWAYGKRLLAKSCHFILPSLMAAIYAQTDKIMLKHMISEAEIGYYSTAVSICSVWCFVLQAIIDSMYPSIAESFKTGEDRFKKLNIQLYSVVIYISVFVSVFFSVFAELIVTVMYGEAYLPSIAPLRVITWHTAFSYLGVARNVWIVCLDRQRYLKYVYFAAAVSNVLLNIVLIPLWGATGAAVASLVAQIITTMVAPFFIKNLRENSFMMLKAVFFRFN